MIKFRVLAKMAHFSHADANVAAFTFSFPPRPVIVGMMGAAMGLAFAEAHRSFAMDRCRIGVGVRCRPYSFPQTVNFQLLKGKESGRMRDWAFGLPNTTTPFTEVRPTRFDILMAEEGMLVYDIYIAHTDKGLLDDLLGRLSEQRFVYPLSMGSCCFPVRVESAGFISDWVRAEKKGGQIEVSTVCAEDQIVDIDLGTGGRVYRETGVPVVVDTETRWSVWPLKKYLYSPAGLRVSLKRGYVEIRTENTTLNITFLEGDAPYGRVYLS